MKGTIMTGSNANAATRMAMVIGCLACLVTIVPLMAQAADQTDSSGTPAMLNPPATTTEFVRQRLQSLEETALAAVEPLGEGVTKELDAIVMHTHGRVQWRSGVDADWRTAAVDDSLQSGAMIRTGLKSALTLRVGLNATILIDSNSRVTLPNMLHNGDTLETAVKVARGQADIKVNRVGLTNDFSVVTPTGALAVKGTGFGVRSDAYGTSVVGSRENMMNAIEVQYYASKLAYYLSGGAISSSDQQNPTLAALLETAPPPSTNKAEQQDAADADTPAGEAQASTNPINQTIRIDLAIQQQEVAAEATRYIEEELIEDLQQEQDLINDILALPGFEEFNAIPELFQGELAAAIYFDLITDFNDPEVFHPGSGVIPLLFQEKLLERLDYSNQAAVADTMGLIVAYGDAQGNGSDDVPGPEHLRAILAIVDNFCRQTFAGNEVKIQICRDCYSQAMYEAFFDAPLTPNSYLEYLSENMEHDGQYEGIEFDGNGQISPP